MISYSKFHTSCKHVDAVFPCTIGSSWLFAILQHLMVWERRNSTSVVLAIAAHNIDTYDFVPNLLIPSGLVLPQLITTSIRLAFNTHILGLTIHFGYRRLRDKMIHVFYPLHTVQHSQGSIQVGVVSCTFARMAVESYSTLQCH
jgi:hypothetical protein